MTGRQIGNQPYKWPLFCKAYDITETPIIHLIAEKKKEILITNHSVYFTLPLEEDPKFIVKGKVPYDQIGTFSVEKLEKQ